MIAFSVFDACVVAMLLGAGATVAYFRGPGLVQRLARRVWSQVRTLQRRLVLEPNMGSKVLVEEYVFALSHPVVLGVPTEFERRSAIQPLVANRLANNDSIQQYMFCLSMRGPAGLCS
jgi:hypothetical protein